MNPIDVRETSVYSSSRDSSKSCDRRGPLSPSVQCLASAIYKELEVLVETYGNKFLQNLMPLIVSTLENLDTVNGEKQNLQLNLAVMKEDHRLLITEYDKEKSFRKTAEAKAIRLEDELEEVKKQCSAKQAELESTARVNELKLKNLHEQISRFDEREAELVRNYQCLHDRYSYLVRSYVDYVDRIRNGVVTYGCDEGLVHGNRVDGTVTSANHERISASTTECTSPFIPLELVQTLRATSTAQPNSVNDFGMYSLESERQRIIRSILETTPELQDCADILSNGQLSEPGFDELSQTDLLSEDGHDIKSCDGSSSTPQAHAGDASNVDIFTGVKREVNNLIKENQDLVQTKNALNVVANDLIGRIDDLTCDNVRLSSERNVLITNGAGMLLRIKDLEQECRRLRHELESIDLRDSMYTDSIPSDMENEDDEEDEDSDTPLSMRKRFSRMEMARVLLERNQYKEQLYDLQEAVRWADMLRAEQQYRGQAAARQKRSRIWEFFARLFTPSKSRGNSISTGSQPAASVVYESPGDQTNNGIENGHVHILTESEEPTGQNVLKTDRDVSFTGSVHQSGSDTKGTVAIGDHRNPLPFWLLPFDQNDWMPVKVGQSNTVCALGADLLPQLSYVRPICENIPTMKLWCATGVFADVGVHIADGPNQWDSSLFSCHDPTHPLPVDINTSQSLDLTHGEANSSGQLPPAQQNPDSTSVSREKFLTSHKNDENLTSVMWVCSAATGSGMTYKNSTVESANDCFPEQFASIHSLITIVDVSDPSQNLDSFGITASTVLCICAVPGTTPVVQHYLESCAHSWNLIPLDLSEEILSQSRMTSSRTTDFSTHAATEPRLETTTSIDSNNVVGRAVSATLWTSSPYSSANKHRHPSLMEVSHPLRNVTPPIPHSTVVTGVTVPEPRLSYFVERRRFLVRHISSELDVRQKPASARSESQQFPSDASRHNMGSNDGVELPSSSDAVVSHGRLTGCSSPSSAQPTVWLGCYNGDLFVHSTVANWRRCLHAIHLPDSVVQICHFNGKVFVSLANGQLIVFRRHLTTPISLSPTSMSTHSVKGAVVSSSNMRDSQSTVMSTSSATVAQLSTADRSMVGTWDFTEVCVITCGHARSPLRQTIAVPPTSTIWTALGNHILLIDVSNLHLVDCIDVPGRQDSQVQCMSWFDDGVWVSNRRESILRLYHVITHQLVQTLDLEPLLAGVSPIIKTPSAFKPRSTKVPAAAITAMLAYRHHLWIGTRAGLIALIPFAHAHINLSDNMTTSGAECSQDMSHADPVDENVFRSTLDVTKIQVSRCRHNGPVKFLTSLYGSSPDKSKPDEMRSNFSLADRQFPSSSTPLRRTNSWNTLSPHLIRKKQTLILCGGEGYVRSRSTRCPDFRRNHLSNFGTPIKDQNHLFVWKLKSSKQFSAEAS
ncbi:unnamed protein product [Calicophoron daubneyi]|uniref:Uncharacterized protein n=1 Tax=Calicophoron daubneyi TaxID=300641 RepID=A0AAV2TPQ2_CALDB